MRDVIDDQFFPTQQRVLQLQDKMGEMAKDHFKLQTKASKTENSLNECMGIGKKTLEHKIMDSVTGSIRAIERGNQDFKLEMAADKKK